MKLCGFDVGLDRPFFLIAGPCVIESEQLQMDVAGQLRDITAKLGIPFIFKSSFDKANRSSGTSYRGPGRDKGLEILAKVKRELGVQGGMRFEQLRAMRLAAEAEAAARQWDRLLPVQLLQALQHVP